jgi:hypothetical protein
MRAEYSITLAGLLLTGAAAAAPCPPALTKVASRVAELRGVSGTFSPPCRLIEPGSLRAELDHKLRRDLPVSPELFIESLVRLGFVEGEPSVIYKNLLSFYSGQVLGFYEPHADEMVVVNTPAAGQVEGALVWAHELAHAVQEHRFHLPSRLLAMRSDGDEQRAASAVAEGEAMLVMFLLDTPARDTDSLERAARAVRQQARALGTPAGVPDYFVADLVFPYTTGFTAALRAYRGGGWAAVDRLLSQPPTTTAALLHADRVDTPGEVPASELPPVPEGWEEVLTDSMGEWGLSYLLGRRLETGQAADVASGWDGDRLRLIRERANPGQWALAWRLRARTVEARRTMEQTMQRELPALLARLAPPGPPTLTWVTFGRTLEVRATWPSGQRPPRSPS